MTKLQYTCDANNRVTSGSYFDGAKMHTESVTYDAAGNPLPNYNGHALYRYNYFGGLSLNMKKCTYIILLSLNSVLTLALILFSGIIRTYIDMYLPLGALLVFPMLILIVYICEFILLVIGISRLIPKLKFRYFFSTVISLILLAAILFVPGTGFFGNINYKLNYELRKEFIESLESNIDKYQQTDMNTYLVNDIRLSYTGTVKIDVKDEVTKVMFDVYVGFGGNRVLIYTSNDEIAKTDFDEGSPHGCNLEYKSIKKLDDHWWLATI